MKTLYTDRKKAGYSEEEAYFAKLNRELIQKIREENSDDEYSDNVIEASHRFNASDDVQNANEPLQNDKKAA